MPDILICKCRYSLGQKEYLKRARPKLKFFIQCCITSLWRHRISSTCSHKLKQTGNQVRNKTEKKNKTEKNWNQSNMKLLSFQILAIALQPGCITSEFHPVNFLSATSPLLVYHDIRFTGYASIRWKIRLPSRSSKRET